MSLTESRPGTSLPPAAEPRWTARLWAVLAVLCLVLFLDGLDVSMVGIALPFIGHDLGLATGSLQWIPTLLIRMSEPFVGLADPGCRVWLSAVCRPWLLTIRRPTPRDDSTADTKNPPSVQVRSVHVVSTGWRLTW
ncbi:hypothetical protein [Streptomyces carpinensis]|uniref:hypothetical protein n=1 Tax=Streptomyces carpinensis TaxID=66369 RepID=UPI001ABF7BB6